MSLILVAMQEEWNNWVCPYLHSYGYRTITAYNQEEFSKLLHQQTKLDGIVVVSDWVMSEPDRCGIIKQLRGKIPTVTIITYKSREESGYRYMEEVFFPPEHEYVTQPFGVEELIVRMEKAGMISTGPASVGS